MAVKSIQQLLEAVKESRTLDIRSWEIEDLVRRHFDGFKTPETGIERVEVKPVSDSWCKGFSLDLRPCIGGTGTHPFPKYVNIVEYPAPHVDTYCLLDDDDEAWVKFFEQFGWTRLGFLDKLERGQHSRVYEIGRKFDYGFWAIIAVR